MKPLICIHNMSLEIEWLKILENINLDIFPWEIISIIWLNWSWKTSLLKTIIWVYTPTSWEININTNKIWYVPQKIDFDKTIPISVYELINSYTNKSKKQINETLIELWAEWLIDKSIGTLSWWQMQRILIANALLLESKILLLDEPTWWIDILWEKDFYNTIIDIHKKYNISIVMVSHDIHNVFDKSTKIYCLNQTICCSGQPQDILKNEKFKNIFWKHLANYVHNHDK